MGPLAKSDDDRVESLNETPIVNFAPTHTQPSSSFPGENFGDASGLHCAQSTMPYDDNVAFEDALETQVLNFGSETQVFDGGVFVENMETQLIEEFNVESDGEATDKTEVLGGGDELSDGELGRGDEEKTQHTPCKFGDKGLFGQSNRSTNEYNSPGSVPRFTSVRAASLRASGLAAQRIALKGTNCDSHSLSDNVQFLEDSNIKINRSETEVWDDKGSCHDDLSKRRGGKRCKVGCSTVRKLFTKDSYVENEVLPYSDDKAIGGKGALQFPTPQDGSAGLSYVDSQEPGEFSQANALACVQRLIDETKVLFDNELGHGKYSRGNSTCISSAKGPQSLARRANDRGTIEKTGVFDWDDEQEDEGGGDIFCRKKEEFFDGEHIAQRSFTELQKSREALPDRYRDKEGKSNAQSEKLVHSDSRLLHNLKGNDTTAQETGINTRRNLVCEFNEQSNIYTSAGPLEATLGRKDMLNVGLDTQLAAEAMEALFHGEGIANYDANDDQLELQGKEDYAKVSVRRKTKSARSGHCSYDRSNYAGLATRNSKKPKKLDVKSSKQSSVSLQKHPEDVRKRSDTGQVVTRSKRAKIDAEKPSTTYGSMKEPRKLGGAIEDSQCDEFNTLKGNALKTGCSVKKRRLPDELAAFTPTGRRRRQSLAVSQLNSIDNVLSNGKEMAFLKSGEPGNLKENLTTMSNGIRCTKGRRSHRNSSRQCKESDNLDCQSKLSSEPGKIGKSVTGNKRSEGNARTDIADTNKERKTKSSSPASPHMPTMERNSGEQLQQGVGNPCSNAGNNGHKLNKNRSRDGMLAKAMTLDDKRNGADSSLSTENEENPQLDKSPKDTTKAFQSPRTSPANCKTPVNAASPVCVGNGYSKLSCKKNMSRSSLMRELSSLCATGLEPISPPKDLRKRRDLASVQVLFSQHLDEDTLKHQRKIVDRLKISVASYIMEATHFISDKFVRTRNMLEAIASGKPVVTHLWLENVGRANYYIDEEKFILRDTKKEKEFGFNMAVSLAHARQHPLLQGKRVLITPNAKPSKEIILNLVKAVHGKAVQRVGKSALKDDTVPDDLLVLSCEEDYEACVPFLERGAAVYSSELLLNGIVVQKLEYERHQLFVDQVKRTRSTVWLKKDGRSFIPVPKHK